MGELERDAQTEAMERQLEQQTKMLGEYRVEYVGQAIMTRDKV